MKEDLLCRSSFILGEIDGAVHETGIKVLSDLEILDMLHNRNVRALCVEWQRGAVVYPYMELLAG